jgi:two-component system chemotaxis response regulator CheB
MPENIRVLIVDDSRLFRGVLEDSLAGLAGVTVAGSVWNGVRAMEFLERTPVDLVTLDLEMPQMDGLETLRAIQQFNAARPSSPPVAVLVVSAYSCQGAAVTIAALEAGAFDFVTKPSPQGPEEGLGSLRQQFQNKVRLFQARRLCPPRPAQAEGDGRRPRLPPARGPHKVRAVVVGVSTGGPAALVQLLPDLTGRVAVPVLVVQHMPAGFTRSLADSLARKCYVPVTEADDGQLVAGPGVLIAPGNRHLLVRGQGEGRVMTVLNDQPPQNGCRPSADVLFRSAALAYGAEAVGIILTGMGCDGTDGLGALKRVGAATLAQDEASSVVWGMPGSAVAAGHIDQVLPLGKLAAAVQTLAVGPAAADPAQKRGGP